MIRTHIFTMLNSIPFHRERERERERERVREIPHCVISAGLAGHKESKICNAAL